MTIPVGISSFFLLPDTPHTTRAWYLTKKERQLATERVLRAGKAKPVKVTIATFKKILSSWKWYAFVMGYVVSQPRILFSDVQMCEESNTDGKLYGESCGASTYFGIWLKSEGFSVIDRNLIPTGTSLISGTCVVIWGFLSDYTGSRFLWIIIPLVSLPEILVFA